jgi:hypothetical protein
MKKTVLFLWCLLSFSVIYAQNYHAIKLGANIARVSGDIPEYSDISSRVGPALMYVFRVTGDRWGYFLELGYSQSGFKEVYDRTYIDNYGRIQNEHQENTLKVHNIDLVPAGLQYAFLSDWSKVRPILQTSVMTRLSVSYTIKTLEGSESELPDRLLDVIWTIGGGVMVTRHATFMVNYGWGFLDILKSDSGLKNRQLQISGCYFF